jgi:hypothetical protein
VSYHDPADITFSALFDLLREGRISRRSFIQRALMAGMAAPVALHVANAVSGQTPVAADYPSTGMDEVVRGEGGEL